MQMYLRADTNVAGVQVYSDTFPHTSTYMAQNSSSYSLFRR